MKMWLIGEVMRYIKYGNQSDNSCFWIEYPYDDYRVIQYDLRLYL